MDKFVYWKVRIETMNISWVSFNRLWAQIRASNHSKNTFSCSSFEMDGKENMIKCFIVQLTAENYFAW